MPETSIEDRILDAFPSGNYGLLALLRLMDVVETGEVDTAAVECTAFPRLLINPEFVERSAATPERLLMLVMHELHHVLLGHTRLFPRLTPADNLIFDAVINALLCRMFPGEEYTSFFTGMYRDNVFPECMLRPAAGWSPHAPAPVPPALAAGPVERLRGVYRALYSETGANYQELYDALRSSLAGQPMATPLLIGSHGAVAPELTGAVFEVVRSVVERWPQPPNPIAGRSWSELLDLSLIPLRPSNRAELRCLLRKVAGRGNQANAARRSPPPFPVMSPVPAADRRAVVLRGLGVPQLLYHSESSGPRPLCDLVHVYVDVSGSIGGYKGALYAAVLDCSEIVHRAVHLFSTVVHDMSLEQLRRGECRTTNGTSIECVARHMRANRIRRAVLLTDGAVGTPGREASATLARATVGIALTPGYSIRTDLQPYARYWTHFHEEKN